MKNEEGVDKEKVTLTQKVPDGHHILVTQRWKEPINLWKEVSLCLISYKPLSVFFFEPN